MTSTHRRPPPLLTIGAGDDAERQKSTYDADVDRLIDDRPIATVDVERLAELVAAPSPEHIAIVDYRSQEEYCRCHIRGSHHATLPMILLNRLLKGRASPLTSIATPNPIGNDLIIDQHSDNDSSAASSASSTAAPPMTCHNAAAYRAWLQSNARNTILVLVTSQVRPPDDIDNVTRLLVSKFDELHFDVRLFTGQIAELAIAHPHLCSSNSIKRDDNAEQQQQQRPTLALRSPTALRPGIEHLSLAEACQQQSMRGAAPTVDANDNAIAACNMIACCSNQLPSPTVVISPRGKKYHPYARAMKDPIVAPIAHCKVNGKIDEFPVKILPHLFLGNASNSEDRQTLDKHGIRYIINVTPNIPNKFECDDDFEYLQLSVKDHCSENLAEHFNECCHFIERARLKNNAVLVHCVAGISRSVTITVAYIMWAKRMTLEQAFDFVQLKKPNISPNFQFMSQLDEWGRKLRQNVSSSLLEPLPTACIEPTKPIDLNTTTTQKRLKYSNHLDSDEENLPVLKLVDPRKFRLPHQRRRIQHATDSLSSPTSPVAPQAVPERSPGHCSS